MEKYKLTYLLEHIHDNFSLYTSFFVNDVRDVANPLFSHPQVGVLPGILRH